MNISTPKLLFIPVSSAEGMGEYMRSLIIADEVKRRRPDAHICFILSRHAPYASTCHHPVKLIDDTPTKRVKEVNLLMSDFLPDVVLFDASGRRSQLEHAQQLGAKVIFLSQHKRKRSRGMRIRRAIMTDSHWVVQPKFMISPINWFDKLKLKLINRMEPIVTGPIFINPNKTKKNEQLSKYQLIENEYLIFNAGSGGHQLNKGYAADELALAAKQIYAQTQLPCLMVFGDNYPKKLPCYEGVISVKSMQHGDFINLLSAAKAAVLSGGDTLLQAIALKKPVLTVAVSKDQHYRLNVCKVHDLAVASECNVESIVDGTIRLIKVERLNKQHQSLSLCECVNGLDIGLKEIERLLGEKLGTT
ncbi:hypothetical protein [Shewanella surugensis]|uniref:Glycosyltransferase family 9 protein n=1 Tax=Shewanella surugensis TaxID=212020 RepID=A0ABT0L9M0_9GAMM|nr:hypothetical protein [Shewanella surugensis]MCL1124413.1 hypothetical protein [Shewanella surugensis]